jgi:glucose 1-dehydrogenase
MPKLSGKNALVTGASSGIGEAVAIRFAREGANVVINYHTGKERAEAVQAKAREAAKTAGNSNYRDLTVKADVSNEEDVKTMFAKAVEALGSIDILINNSGVQKPAPSNDVEMTDYDRVVNTNVRGSFMCCREALRHFLQRGIKGVIVSNSSVHEIIPKPKYLPYSISKGGMENMTKSLALEYANKGIRINAVGPGAIVTPINNAWINDPKARAEVESHIPMGRAGTSEEIASVFVFLASDESSYITGQTIFACGGLTLYPEFAVAWSSGE